MALLCMALSFGGIVGAHSLSYFLFQPDPHARHQLLHATGHSAWGQVGVAAGAIAIAALVAFVSLRLRNEAGTPKLARVAPLLVFLQVSGFLLLEGIERSGIGSGALSIFSEDVVQLGIVVQVLVALGLAAAVLLLTRVVDLIVSRLRDASLSRQISPSWWPSERSVPPRPFSGKAFDVRGPPVSLRI